MDLGQLHLACDLGLAQTLEEAKVDDPARPPIERTEARGDQEPMLAEVSRLDGGAMLEDQELGLLGRIG